MSALATMQQNGQAPVLLTSEQFLAQTKAKSVKVVSAQAYVDGGTSNYQLPQAGLGHMLWVIIQGTITVAGTVTSGTFKTYPNPAPFSIIKRVRFGSNNALNLRDLSGWSWYKWIRYRYGIDPLAAKGTYSYSANNTAALGVTGSALIRNGANVAAQAYTFNLALPMPISYNNAAEQGLIVLQQNVTFYTLSIDWGQVVGGISTTGGSNDLFTTLVGTGLSVTASISVTVGLEYFEALPGIGRLISMFMSATDMITPIAAGDNMVKFPTGDYFTMFLLEAINNGAPLAVANIQNPQFMYAGNVYDNYDDYLVRLGHAYYQHDGVPPMDGVIDWDLGTRRGLLARRDTLDAFDNLNVTDGQLRFTVPGTVTITGNSGVYLVMESLRYLRQG